MFEQDSDYQHYLDHFSLELSEEIKEYAIEEVFKHSRYIFTRRQGKKQYGYCTYCEGELQTDGLKHNTIAICPNCQSECLVKSSGRGRKTMIDEAYFTYYQKSVKNPEIITARGIYVARDYRGNYRLVKTQYRDAALYIFEMGNSIMLSRYVGIWSYFNYYSNEIECGTWSKRSRVGCMWRRDHISSSNVSVHLSRSSIAAAVKDTPFQYSTWESYEHDDMVNFFNLSAKYPCIEYLTKLGFKHLVDGKLDNYNTYSAVNWRGKNLLNVLKIDKKDLKEFKDQNIVVTFLFLKLYQISKKDKSNLSYKEIKAIENSYGPYMTDLKKILKYTSLGKANGYIFKQYKKHEKKYYSTAHDANQIIINWRDYINDCISLEMDLTQENVLFPRDLYKAHQNTIKQVRIKADKELDKKIKARAKRLNTQYGFEYKGLIIKAASSTTELINEGKKLDHCVGNYARGYAEGKNIILFVRRKSKPNQPYFTMEIRNGSIIQLRGKRNCSADKRVDAFAEAFKSEKLEKKIKNRVTIPA